MHACMVGYVLVHLKRLGKFICVSFNWKNYHCTNSSPVHTSTPFRRQQHHAIQTLYTPPVFRYGYSNIVNVGNQTSPPGNKVNMMGYFLNTKIRIRIYGYRSYQTKCTWGLICFTFTLRQQTIRSTSYSHTKKFTPLHWKFWIDYMKKPKLVYTWILLYQNTDWIQCLSQTLSINAVTDKKKSNFQNLFLKSCAKTYFLIGYLTTRGALLSLIQILAKRPELQRAMQDEIDSVTGTTREPALADRHQCHLVEAVTLETLRYISHGVITPHCTSQATEILGVPVGKNTPACCLTLYLS